jgi:hypothetical protein
MRLASFLVHTINPICEGSAAGRQHNYVRRTLTSASENHNFNRPYVFSNSYPTQASGAVGGGYQGRQNPFAQHDEPAYEMSDVKDSTTQLSASIVTEDSMSAFYSEVMSLLVFS